MDLVKNMIFLDKLFEGVYLVDQNRTIVFWNTAAETITGFLAIEVIGKKCFENILMHVDERGESLCRNGCHLQKTLEDGEPRESSIYLRHKQGHKVPVNVRSIAIRDDEGRIQYSVEMFTRGGLEANMEQFQDLARKAFIDSLTGAPNKDYIVNKLKSLLISKVTTEEDTFGVMFLELDDLRKINEDYGINAGNNAIKAVSKTILEHLEPGSLIGRISGGLFLIITNIDKKAILLNWANKLNLLVQRLTIPGYEELVLTIGIGGAVVRSGENVELVYKSLEQELKNSRNVAIKISVRD